MSRRYANTLRLWIHILRAYILSKMFDVHADSGPVSLSEWVVCMAALCQEYKFLIFHFFEETLQRRSDTGAVAGWGGQTCKPCRVDASRLSRFGIRSIARLLLCFVVWTTLSSNWFIRRYVIGYGKRYSSCTTLEYLWALQSRCSVAALFIVYTLSISLLVTSHGP